MATDEKSQFRLAVTQRVTWVGAVVNVVLTVGKIIFGMLTHSQSLIADGIHSLSDLLSDALVLVAARHSQHGPDQEHPYGHGRIETAATLGLGILLTLVAIGIGWDAVNRMFAPEELLQPTSLAIYVALVSVLAKEGLYHYTMRAAKLIKSDMVKANAWHHRSDAISSVVVLVGVAGTLAGLSYLDAVAAVLVALMIAHVGWEVGAPAFHELVDAGLEEDDLQKITDTILSVSGVKAVHMLRTRKIGGGVAVDVHVLLTHPWLSVTEGHYIGQTVIDRLRDGMDDVTDVTVHIDPEDDEVITMSGGLPHRDEVERMLDACWQDIPHARSRTRLLLHYLDGRIDVDIFFHLKSFSGLKDSDELREQLQTALDPLAEFGRLKVFYG